jgi:hypothetical protein
MSAPYRVCCGRCGYAAPASQACDAAVVVDEPSSSLFAHPEDKRLVVLPSFESQESILKELGLSYRAAALTGRLVLIRKVICRTCGTLYELRKLGVGLAAPGCSGFFLMALVAIVGGVTVGLITRAWWAGLLAGLGGLVLLIDITVRALSAYVRWRYRERASAFDRQAPCPRCGKWGHVAVVSVFRRVFPCPQCGQRSLRVRFDMDDPAKKWGALQPFQRPVFSFLPDAHMGPEKLLEFRAGRLVRVMTYLSSSDAPGWTIPSQAPNNRDPVDRAGRTATRGSKFQRAPFPHP